MIGFYVDYENVCDCICGCKSKFLALPFRDIFYFPLKKLGNSIAKGSRTGYLGLMDGVDTTLVKPFDNIDRYNF